MHAIFRSSLISAMILSGLSASIAPAWAKSAMSSISMGEFDRRCRAAGGTIANIAGGGHRCNLPSGQSVTCYDQGAQGIACDWRVASQPKADKLLGGSIRMK